MDRPIIILIVVQERKYIFLEVSLEDFFMFMVKDVEENYW